jgi:hypothetical protein
VLADFNARNNNSISGINENDETSILSGMNEISARIGMIKYFGQQKPLGC